MPPARFEPSLPPPEAGVDEFETLVLGEVGVVLAVECGEREFAGRQQSAIRESVAGRGQASATCG